MYVTSDIFDLKRIGRFRNYDWQEHLLGGIAVHGTEWPGYQAGARFLLEALRSCGVTDEIVFFGYRRREDKRSRPIKLKSFEKLERGELAGAHHAVGLLLEGERKAANVYTGAIHFGGETDL
ncbi:MAG TPA: hypothetical protein VHY34_00245, partial [Caulobacteraceae bacterium]|nr:hypothetical protein [Caulobacteraceae bacterium]